MQNPPLTDGGIASAAVAHPISQATAGGERKRLLFVVNVGWFFVSHRLPLAIAAARAGYDVHIATALDPRLDAQTPTLLAQLGLTLHPLELSRSGAHPLELLRQFASLFRLVRSIRPVAMHLVTLKPVLLGGIAARLARVPGVVLAVPGRGTVFSEQGYRALLRRVTALILYKLAYRAGRTRVILQNEEDREYFLTHGVFAPADVRLVRGSGVDLERFTVTPEPDGVPVVVLASRMLKEKGIADFVAAARLVNSERRRARFALVGEPDYGNPHSHTEAELEAWVASGAVEWWGLRADMNAVFASAAIVCLPTFYGEGVPKVLIEAAACARPIVTTDAPGCRDIVRHDVNGLLVPARNVQMLAQALSNLVDDPQLRARMGTQGRARVIEQFQEQLVTQQTLSIYRELAACGAI